MLSIKLNPREKALRRRILEITAPPTYEEEAFSSSPSSSKRAKSKKGKDKSMEELDSKFSSLLKQQEGRKQQPEEEVENETSSTISTSTSTTLLPMEEGEGNVSDEAATTSPTSASGAAAGGGPGGGVRIPSAASSTSSSPHYHQDSDTTNELASIYFNPDDLAFLYQCLPRMTKEMLVLCGRNEPAKLTMADLRHSLMTTQGSDAAIRIEQAKRISRVALDLIHLRAVQQPTQPMSRPTSSGSTSSMQSTSFYPSFSLPGSSPAPRLTPLVRLLEIGSGFSDVTSMVWALLIKGIREKNLHVQWMMALSQQQLRGGGDTSASTLPTNMRVVQPTDLFEIVNIEQNETRAQLAQKFLNNPTSATASLHAPPRSVNITIYSGKQEGDPTTLKALADDSFDITWTSLVLGAYGEPPASTEDDLSSTTTPPVTSPSNSSSTSATLYEEDEEDLEDSDNETEGETKGEKEGEAKEPISTGSTTTTAITTPTKTGKSASSSSAGGGNSKKANTTKPLPTARAIIQQAHRVTKHGGLIMHTDYVYLYGRKDDAPWSVVNSGGGTSSIASLTGSGRPTLQLPFRLEAAIGGRHRGLVRADHHHQPRATRMHHRLLKAPSFLRRLNEQMTSREFENWSWFDGGDYAAWEMNGGLEAGDYSNVTIKRYCGTVSHPGRAALALAHLYFNDWEKMNDEELEDTLSHLKEAGTSFVCAIGTVNKGEEKPQ